ncbi:MAG: SLC13 family permease [Verrucomicrobiota bacterium]|jgi:Na+/H+ antiporter NhaD/arsenite permease-like protein
MNSNANILAIFAITYLGLAMGRIPGLKLNRVGIALLGAIAMMIFGHVATSQAIAWVNWPTICLLFGFFVISAQLRLSGFYNLVAEGISERLGHPARFLFILMVVTGGLSAFLNHDIVCFVFTPIVATALLRQRLNPAPFLVALAIASNIGAAATLIGNAQDMLIGQTAHLAFGRYLLWSSVPVAFAMTCAYGIIWFLSRNQLQLSQPAPDSTPEHSYPFNRTHTIKGLIVLTAVIGLFFSSLPTEILALAAAGIHLASPKFRTEELLALVDWPILVLFVGLFVVTGAFVSTGFGDQAVARLAQAGFNLDRPVNLTITTAVLTSLINNSPTVMLLLKVVHPLTPTAAYILALANSFGGSLLIIGSVANLITVQQARDLGVKISFWDFSRLGLPVTLASLAGLLAWVKLMS